MKSIKEVLNFNEEKEEYNCKKCGKKFNEWWYFIESGLTGHPGIQCPKCEEKYFL